MVILGLGTRLRLRVVVVMVNVLLFVVLFSMTLLNRVVLVVV